MDMDEWMLCSCHDHVDDKDEVKEVKCIDDVLSYHSFFIIILYICHSKGTPSFYIFCTAHDIA